MTSQTPYFRPELTATRAGILDPALLVDVWLDRLVQAIEDDPVDSASPEAAYDLLACRARLLRVRPDLFEAACTEAVRQAWVAAEEYVRGKSPQLLNLAKVVPNPEAWLAEVEEFHDALATSSDDVGLSAWGERLLEDLDDGDLAGWSARALGQSDGPLEEALERCREWLDAHATDFLACAVAVQAAGAAIRPDLPGYDLALARTADKYVVLLDAQEEAETLVPDVPLSADVVRALFALPRTQPEPVGHAWEWYSPLAMAASTSSGTMKRCEWYKPGEAYRAIVVAGPTAQRVQVMFFRGNADAVELCGLPTELAGVAATIDEQGSAYYSLAELRQARDGGMPDSLVVAGQNWRPAAKEGT